METKITLGQIWQQDRRGMFNWLVLEAVALVLAAWAVRMLVWGSIEITTLVFYGIATAASITAGYEIANRVAPRIMARRDMVKLLNDRVHKWAVVGLNGIVSAALVYKLATDMSLPADQRHGSLAVLGIFATMYAVSYLFRFVRAHSVFARFRSAVLRATLIMVMADMLWGMVAFAATGVLAVFVLVLVFKHLLRESDRWGWDTR